MNEQLIASIAAKAVERFNAGWADQGIQFNGIEKYFLDALREYATTRAATPYSGEVSPDALRIEADRQEESGNVEGAAMLRAAAEKWGKAIPIPFCRAMVGHADVPLPEGSYFASCGERPEDGYLDADGNVCRTATWFKARAHAEDAIQKFLDRQPVRRIYDEAGYPDSRVPSIDEYGEEIWELGWGAVRIHTLEDRAEHGWHLR